MGASKIRVLATVGPASLKENIIRDMDRSGTDIFRINLSHTRLEDLEEVIRKLRSWTRKTICVDTEGAQIRTGKCSEGQITLETDSMLDIVRAREDATGKRLSIYPEDPRQLLRTGDLLRIDFHSVIVQVLEVGPEAVRGRVIQGGVVGSNKAIAIDRMPELPTFTEKDKKAFVLCAKFGIDCYALSFAYRSEDIDWLRSQFREPVFVISKVESYNALLNLEEIAKASDALLIDRGDLSREIPLQKIGTAQRYVMESANKFARPVYVATNLLDSMISGKQPSRAEINDITSTLLTGAQGLVLSAETAIGTHPVQVVRMATGVIMETQKFTPHESRFDIREYLRNVYENSLVPAHGGRLVGSLVKESELANLSKKSRSLEVDSQTAMDIEQLSVGTYSPLDRFMGLEEMNSVLDAYCLRDGIAWTLPILLQLHEDEVKFARGDTVRLHSRENDGLLGIIEVERVEKIPDMDVAAEKWFGTNDNKHPGVAYFRAKGEWLVSGRVYGTNNSARRPYVLRPRQIREVLRNLGYATVVGFHTRNVPHRGHEFIQKAALDRVNADALLVSPIIGVKKEGDFAAGAILKAYETVISEGYFEPHSVLLAPLETYSRYSGPREAVFTALCRKNFGCSHFIVGRDHTGVGDYYSQDASQTIFDKIGDLGITPVFFDPVYYCYICGEVTDNCSHSEDDRKKISATEVRNCLVSDQTPPEYLIRREVSDLLRSMLADGEQVFEG